MSANTPLKLHQSNPRSPDPDEELWSFSQVCKRLGIGVSTGERLKAAHKLPAHIALSRTLHRWKKSEILAWIAANCPARAEWEAIHR